MANNLKDVMENSVKPIIIGLMPDSDVPAHPMEGKQSPKEDSHKNLYKEANTRINRWEEPTERAKRQTGWGSPS